MDRVKTYPMWDCRTRGKYGVQGFQIVAKTKKMAEQRISSELALRKSDYLKCRKYKTLQGSPLGAMGGEIRKIVTIRHRR